MIFTTQNNTNPMDLSGMAIRIQSSTVNTSNPTYSTNDCQCCSSCSECYEVWGGGEDWQNDNTTFAFVKTLATDTFTLSLWQGSTKLTDITDSTLGDYTPSYGSNPKQYSFVIDWDKVYQTYGVGEYTLKNDYTSIGIANSYESSKFCLYAFDSCSSNGWIKIDWIQTGDILSNDFKFDVPLFHSYKFKSYLTIETPTTIKDVYQTSNREEEMFRTEQKNNYLLNIKLIRENLLSLLNENIALANKLTITDFNINGTNFKEKDFSFVEFADLEDFQGNKKIDCQIKLTDYKQNIIKTC